MEFLLNENKVWIPDLSRLLSQQTAMEEGRASCQLHKSDSFNMLNFMRWGRPWDTCLTLPSSPSATVLTAHAIISAVNTQNNNNNNDNNNNSTWNSKSGLVQK